MKLLIFVCLVCMLMPGFFSGLMIIAVGLVVMLWLFSTIKAKKAIKKSQKQQMLDRRLPKTEDPRIKDLQEQITSCEKMYHAACQDGDFETAKCWRSMAGELRTQMKDLL